MQQDHNSFLKQEQRKSMHMIFKITSDRRAFMEKIERSMHQQIDPELEHVEYMCEHCKQTFFGKQYGAHYRNTPECKYMKDRPWLTKLPKNWKQDLQRFNREIQGSS